MITLDDYFIDHQGTDRRKQYPHEYTLEIENNAIALLEKVNKLLDTLGIGAVKVSSGWRPSAVNLRVGGAKNSNHITGHAVDIADQFRYLAKAILRNIKLLDECGLYAEDFGHTKTWVHLQDIAPKSGKRIFIP